MTRSRRSRTTPDGAKKLLQFGPAYRVQPDTYFITEVRQLLGASAVT